MWGRKPPGGYQEAEKNDLKELALSAKGRGGRKEIGKRSKGCEKKDRK